MSRRPTLVSLKSLVDYQRHRLELYKSRHYGREDDHTFIKNMFLEFMTHSDFYCDHERQEKDFDIITKRQDRNRCQVKD